MTILNVPSIIQHPQEQIHYVRVRLFHLIKEYHAVGPPPHGFRQLPPCFMANVAGRRTDEA